MGAAEAKANPSLFASYKFIQKKSSAAFGDLTIMQDLKTKQLVAIREQVFQSMKDYEQENSKLSKQAQFLHPNIIQLRQVNSFCEKQFCSSVYKILHAIEYIPTDVESDLKQRKQPYTEHDLMALLKDVSSAMQFLQIKGMTHGDLRLSTIFTQSNGPNKKQIYKIAEPSVLRVMPAYLSVLTGHESKGLFFSPKLLDGLRQKNWTPKHNVSKSDVFALGCILLECALAKSSDDMFDFNESKFIKQVLEDRKLLIQQQFSEDFQAIIFRMLSLDESKRPDFIELSQILEKNENHHETNVLKPYNRQGFDNVLKENQTDKSKAMSLDSFRSLDYSQDKENKPNQPPTQQKPKVFIPLLTVLENNDELMKKTDQLEDFIEPMRPDALSSEPVLPKLNFHEDHIEKTSPKPNNTPTTEYNFKESIEKQPELYQITENQFEITANEEKQPDIFPSEMAKEDVFASKSSIYEYEKGVVSFIRPEIQAILNEFKKDKTTEIPEEKNQKDENKHNARVSDVSDLQPLNYAQESHNTEEISADFNKILVYETYEDGSVYHGEKLNNMRHGKGKFYYSDGGMYDGEWKEGHIDGFGVLFYPNGCIAYQGEWNIDKFHGKGIVYNESPSQINEFNYKNFEDLGEGWIKYEGNFVEDNKDGEGILTLVNGDLFVGKFFNDHVHGNGNYYQNQGGIIQGEWIHNLFKDECYDDFEEKI